MRYLKTPTFVLALSLAVIPCFAAPYSLNGAAQAAGALMPKGGPAQMALFNLPEPKAKPADLLKVLRQARDQKAYLAITSPKIEFIHDLLGSALKAAKKNEKFSGLNLIIIGDRVDERLFDTTLKAYDIAAKHGTF